MLPMIFRKVDLSFEKLGQWRIKLNDVLISLAQLQIGLSESWKLCLNLCLRRWLKPNVNLVNNSTNSIGIMTIEESASRRAYEIQKCFLEDIPITAEGKKGILKETMLYFN